VSLVLVLTLASASVTYAAPPPEEVPVPIEDVTKRTANTRTLDNRDGTYTLEGHLAPIHYLDPATGSYEGIDSSLVATDGAGIASRHGTPGTAAGFTNRSNAFSVFLPEALSPDGAPLAITAPQGALLITPADSGAGDGGPGEGQAPGASSSDGRLSAQARTQEGASHARRPDGSGGNALVYDGVLGPKGTGISLDYRSLARGVKETIVLDAPVDDPTFGFTLSSADLIPSLNEDGSVSFTSRADGEEVFLMPAPYMEDSSKDEAGEPARSDKVCYLLTATGHDEAGAPGTWRLDVVADKEWLDDASRVFPVRVDPTTYYTYVTARSIYDADAFVTSAFPSTNYGYDPELKAGYYSGAGINYTFVRPDLQPLVGQGLSVLDARLRLWCFHRYDSTARAMKLYRADGAWTETGITWNNKPALTDLATQVNVTQNAEAIFDVTGTVREVVLGIRSNHGFAVRASDESNQSWWSKFYSLDNANPNYPVLTVKFTSEPSVTPVAPSAEVPVATGSNSLRFHWEYDDVLGKVQDSAQVQIATSPAATPLVDTGQVTTAESYMSVNTTGKLASAGRYFYRMRVWGSTDELPGTKATSNWTEWQAFEAKSLLSSNNGQGMLGYAAAEPLGGGLFVDLATGRLKGSRTDISDPGVSLPLSLSSAYDSARTTPDSEQAPGWKQAASTLTRQGFAVTNPGFETVSGTTPTGWVIGPSNGPTVESTTADKRSGARSLRFALTSSTVWGNAWVSTHSGTTASAIKVTPGERLTVRAWAKTSGMTVDATQAERGALIKVHYLDGAGNALPTATSAVSPNLLTSTTTGWVPLTLESRVPQGAYYAKANLEMRNARGTIYFDDVEVDKRSLTFTDANGTTRSFDTVGDGVYTRDPLTPGIAFSEVNVGLGTRVRTDTGVLMPLMTDGGFEDCTKYNSLSTGASKFIQMDLGANRVIDTVRMRLYDGPESSTATQPRTYTYRIEVSQDGSSYTQAVAQTTGRSWVTHSFTPVRARYIRVYALGSSVGGTFDVIEMEVPQLRLGDTAVSFDASGRLACQGDLSGNGVRYEYNAAGRVSTVRDGTTNASTGRYVTTTYNSSTGRLNTLHANRLGSSGTAAYESGVVSYLFTPSGSGKAGTYKIMRHDGTKYVDVVTYQYDSAGRIDKVTDADGVGYTVGYDTSDRVMAVNTLGASPVLRIFNYSGLPSQVAITTVGMGVSPALYAPAREVGLSSALGNQATFARTLDASSSTHPTVTYTHDEYGQPWKVKSPSGQVSRAETDGRGNVVVVAQEDAGGKTLKTSEARYDRDHVVWQKDESGNISTFSYDVAWRPTDSAATVSGDTGYAGAEAAGADGAYSTYDGYGHVTTQMGGTGTAYSLLRNGTFHLSPLITGNGWDGTRSGASYVANASDYLGGYVLSLASGGYIISDEVAVKATDVYTLSAWVTGRGSFLIHEYNASHTQIGSGTTVLVNEQTGAARRIAATYAPSSSNVAYVRVRPSCVSGSVLPFLVDNVAFVASARLTPDSLLENPAMEQVSAGHPRGWAPRGGTPATQDASTDAKVVGTKSAHIRTTTASGSMGYFYSDTLGVRPGEKYVAAVSVKTVKSVGGAHALMRFTNSSGGVLSSNDVSVTAEYVTGTSAWRRHVVAFTVPAGAANVQMNLYHEYGGGDAYFDAAVLSPLSGAVTAAYDPSNTFATAVTSAIGVKAGAAYDGRGRATEASVTPAGSATAVKAQAMTYDGLDRLKTATIWTNAGTNTTSAASFAYTDAGRLTSVTDPRGNTSSVAYNAAGQVTSATSATNIKTRTDYDALGRAVKAYVPAQGTTPTLALAETSYDGLSRPKSTTYKDSGGTVRATHTRTYDIEGRVTSEALAGSAGTIASASATSTYDTLGRLTSRTTTSSTGGWAGGVFSTETTYTVADLPKKVTRSAFGAVWAEENTFAKTGDLTAATIAGNPYTFSNAAGASLSSALSAYSYQTRAYDLYDRVESHSSGTRSGASSARLYESYLTYDSRGRAGAFKVDGPTSSDSYTDTYTYSDANQLVGLSRSGAGAMSSGYAYDKAGNVTSRSGTGAASYVYDAENRLTSRTMGGSATTYTNDVYGRRTQESSSATGYRNYAYNELGQLLMSYEPNRATGVYYYGIDGMRAYKGVTDRTVSPAVTTTTTCYYDGEELQAELDNDGKRYTYIWGPEGTPLTLLVKPSGGVTETYSYHTDALGSVVALTSTSGAVVAKYSYDPYGNPVSVGGSNLALAKRNPLRYRSYYYDTETGNYYLPARYCDPSTMRFLTPDPAPASPGNPLTLNRYAYCDGDPVNLDDPDGREPRGPGHCDGYGFHGYNYGRTNLWRQSSMGWTIARINVRRWGRSVRKSVASTTRKVAPPVWKGTKTVLGLIRDFVPLSKAKGIPLGDAAGLARFGADAVEWSKYANDTYDTKHPTGIYRRFTEGDPAAITRVRVSVADHRGVPVSEVTTATAMSLTKMEVIESLDFYRFHSGQYREDMITVPQGAAEIFK